jgi:hypothetical protein
MKSKEKRTTIVCSTLGNLVEALYDSIPRTIRKARQRNLLVALALLDMQTRLQSRTARKLARA